MSSSTKQFHSYVLRVTGVWCLSQHNLARDSLQFHHILKDIVTVTGSHTDMVRTCTDQTKGLKRYIVDLLVLVYYMFTLAYYKWSMRWKRVCSTWMKEKQNCLSVCLTARYAALLCLMWRGCLYLVLFGPIPDPSPLVLSTCWPVYTYTTTQDRTSFCQTGLCQSWSV